jgi:hypothetical protein
MAQKSYKPSGALKKFVDAGKNPTRVITSVERHMLSKPRDGSRRTDVIHPSAMIKSSWCHRAQYFELLGYEPSKASRPASLKQLLVFEEGHRIHARWQSWLGDMGKLYGLWRCTACGQKYWGLMDECCTELASEYLEVPVHNKELRISGHADGWLKGFDSDMLLEIKSVGEGTIRWEAPELLIEHNNDFKKAWSSLKQPFTPHIMQAQVYMKLLEGMFPDDHPKEAIFIYESKVDQEVKEFVVAKSDFGVTELFEAAAMIVAQVELGEPPACNVGGPNLCGSCRDFDDN